MQARTLGMCCFCVSTRFQHCETAAVQTACETSTFFPRVVCALVVFCPSLVSIPILQGMRCSSNVMVVIRSETSLRTLLFLMLRAPRSGRRVATCRLFDQVDARYRIPADGAYPVERYLSVSWLIHVDGCPTVLAGSMCPFSFLGRGWRLQTDVYCINISHHLFVSEFGMLVAKSPVCELILCPCREAYSKFPAHVWLSPLNLGAGAAGTGSGRSLWPCSTKHANMAPPLRRLSMSPLLKHAQERGSGRRQLT